MPCVSTCGLYGVRPHMETCRALWPVAQEQRPVTDLCHVHPGCARGRRARGAPRPAPPSTPRACCPHTHCIARTHRLRRGRPRRTVHAPQSAPSPPAVPTVLPPCCLPRTACPGPALVAPHRHKPCLLLVAPTEIGLICRRDANFQHKASSAVAPTGEAVPSPR